jgi:hypothetical protein
MRNSSAKPAAHNLSLSLSILVVVVIIAIVVVVTLILVERSFYLEQLEPDILFHSGVRANRIGVPRELSSSRRSFQNPQKNK